MIKCLFLVEGPYDKQRLSLLCDLFDSNKIEIFPFGCDMLTEKDYFNNYTNEIKAVLNKEKTFAIEDFNYIVQVCDLDGCFISDECVIENKNINKIIYHSDYIEVIDKNSIVSRNQIKVDNIDRLLNNDNIQLYFNSSNIDHVFDNIQNPSSGQKKNGAINMYSKYKEKPKELLLELFNLNTINATSLESSWREIRKDYNSLSRCTNLIFFIDYFQEFLKEDIRIEYSKLKLKNQI